MAYCGGEDARIFLVRESVNYFSELIRLVAGKNFVTSVLKRIQKLAKLMSRFLFYAKYFTLTRIKQWMMQCVDTYKSVFPG